MSSESNNTRLFFLSLTELRCPNNLTDPMGGAVNISSLSIGGMAVYSCLEGYVLEGTAERVCMNNEMWSGVPPSCRCECNFETVS